MHQRTLEGMTPPAGPSRLPRHKSAQGARREAIRLFLAVEAAFAVSYEDLSSATRGRWQIALARQTGMYLARVGVGMSLSDAGALFGRDRTTAAYACRRIENLRDDRRFDLLLDELEAFIVRPHSHDGSTRR